MNEVWGCAEILPISLKRNLVVAHVIRFSFWEGYFERLITRLQRERKPSKLFHGLTNHLVPWNLIYNPVTHIVFWPQGRQLQRVNTRKIRTYVYSQQEKERYKSKFYRSILGPHLLCGFTLFWFCCSHCSTFFAQSMMTKAAITQSLIEYLKCSITFVDV